MRRAQGYAIWREGDDGKTLRESDTIRCGHCGFIATVPPGCQPGDKCHGCQSFVCERCAAIPMCRTYELHIQAMESRGAFLKAVGLDSVRASDAKRVHKLFEEREAFDQGRAKVVNGQIVDGSDTVQIDTEYERRLRAVKAPTT